MYVSLLCIRVCVCLCVNRRRVSQRSLASSSSSSSSSRLYDSQLVGGSELTTEAPHNVHSKYLNNLVAVLQSLTVMTCHVYSTVRLVYSTCSDDVMAAVCCVN